MLEAITFPYFRHKFQGLLSTFRLHNLYLPVAERNHYFLSSKPEAITNQHLVKMSAAENGTANFGSGENENATCRDRKEGENNTSGQNPQQESSAQDTSDQEDSEFENDDYDSEESDEFSDCFSDDDDDSLRRVKKRDARAPTYCPICLKTAKLFECQGCNDMAYCSKACQRKDWPVHKLLCRQLPDFQATTRPEEHFRAILFPANDVDAGEYLSGAEVPKPKFVWCKKDYYRPFFPPDGSCELQSDNEILMGRRQRVSTQRLLVWNPSIMPDKPRNSCIEAVVGNRLLMEPWPLLGWRGNLLLTGCKGDVTMRDFRAVVDYFQCYPRNRGLVDPSRYLGQTFVGVLIVPNPQIGNPAVEPEVQEIHLTQGMKFYKNKFPMTCLDGLIPVYVLGDTSYISTLSSDVINFNAGSLLLMIDASMKELGEVSIPVEPLSCGAIIYLRKDGKPLLKHHYEALSAFVCRQAIQAAGAQGMSEREMAIIGTYKATREDLKKLLTKDKFREFWAGYCERKRLEATPCPLDM